MGNSSFKIPLHAIPMLFRDELTNHLVFSNIAHKSGNLKKPHPPCKLSLAIVWAGWYVSMPYVKRAEAVAA